MEEIRFELDCDAEGMHFHDEMEILYVLSGRMAVMTANTNFVLNPEQFAVFDPYESHSLYKEKGNHTLSLYISRQMLHYAGLGEIRCCSCIHLEKEWYLQLIRGRLGLLFKGYLRDREDRLYQLSQLFSLLAVLKQEFSAGEGAPHTVESGKDTIREALRYIGDHFTEELSLQQAADHVFWSRSHFSREFQKQAGIPFAAYLRSLRLNLASRLLLDTQRSVTEVAVESGFSNSNTLIANFRQRYGCTPGEFRARHAGQGLYGKTEQLPEDVSYMGLLRHVPYEAPQTLEKRLTVPVRQNVDVRADGGALRLCQSQVISVGWARDLLQENVRNSIRMAKKKIGFRYATFHGLLDDALDVYHEDADGKSWINTTYIDMILDFLLSAGIRPWLELGFTPRLLARKETYDFPYGESVILLPEDPEKWRHFLEHFLDHLTERYGIERVSGWRFAASPALYVSYHVFSMDDYLPYYLATFRAVRSRLPEAFFAGCTLDTGFLTLDGDGLLVQFLEYCTRNGCMPDAISLQCIQCDYSRLPREVTERNITGRGENSLGEPARISRDPQIMKKEIARVREVMDRMGAKECEIVMLSWNSTHWQADLGNDTCFKSAFIFKSFLENSDTLSAMAYSYLTDNTERKIVASNIFHGGTGLVTYRDIPKAACYAYELLGRMEGTVSARGDGFLVSRSEDCKRIRIALYHYCHVREETHVTCALPESEQRTTDRYYGFEDRGVRSFSFYLSGMETGVYQKVSYSVNRRHGSSYDAWMSMGAPTILLSEQLDYLQKTSVPGCYYERVRVDKGETLLISALLEAHEIRVICLDKQ